MNRLLAIPIVLVAMLVGIWITGGLITNDFKLAMLLTAAWVGLLGVICLVVARRRRALAVPVVGTYLVAALAVAIYFGVTTLGDDVVDEDVATASPTAKGKRGPDGGGSGNLLLAEGGFQSGAHASSGTASVIELTGGSRVLTLTEFATDPGPDLRVYLVAGPAADESQVEDFIDLGALKGNEGDQQYEIPADADVDRYRTAVVWCRAFSVLFARAPLEAAA